MIRTPLSTVIGGAFWTPGATVVGGTSKKTFDQLIQSLFANNEQGFFYDPNDLSTMFQDAAGTIPVTAAGQPVGLILDKSKEVLSTEKVVNPDFDSDTAWTKAATVTISNGSAILNGATGNPVLSQNVGLTAGKWYEVTINVTEVTSGVSTFIIYGAGGNDTIFSISSAGIYKAMTMARSDATGLIGFSALLTSVKLSSVSVKELAGNHAYQTTSASRPTLQQDSNGLYYLSFDGTDDGMATPSIDFTGTDKMTVWAGVRKNSDAAVGILAELSTNSDSTNGTFALAASVSGNNYYTQSRGTVRSVQYATGYVAPNSAVLVAEAKISTDTLRLHVNNAAPLSSATDQGTGNYGNYPLYIGRRGGVAYPFNGHLYSLIGIGRLSTASEIAAIEKELAKRTGVSLNV